MLNLELLAQGSDHSVVQVCTIIGDNPVRDTIPANQVLLDEAGNHILCNGCKGSCFNPLGKVVNGDKNEMMSIRGSRIDFLIISIPYIAKGQGTVMTFKGAGGT